jgi:hypothetical protein
MTARSSITWPAGERAARRKRACDAARPSPPAAHTRRRLAELKGELSRTHDELASRTRQLQETADHATSQSDRMRTVEEEHSRATAELQAWPRAPPARRPRSAHHPPRCRRRAQIQCSRAIAETKEKAVAAQQEAARLSEAERLRLIERHETELAAARLGQQTASTENAQLTAKGHEQQLQARGRRNERRPRGHRVLSARRAFPPPQLRERGNRLEGVEQEVALLRKQNAELRDENSSLSSLKHKQEKTAGATEVRIA